MSVTFLTNLRTDLESNGMTAEQSNAVIEKMVDGEADSSMASRWDDDVEGYHEGLYPLIWEICKRYALAYIDEHAPMAWFRPVFLPPSEQEAFLKAEKEKEKEMKNAFSATDFDAALNEAFALPPGVSPEMAKLFPDSGASKGLTVEPRVVKRYTPLEVSVTPAGIEVDCADVIYYPESPTFRLEDGGTYLNRMKEVITVKRVSNSSKFPFERTNGGPELFMEDGRYNDSVGQPINALDLVEEVPDRLLRQFQRLHPHQQKLIKDLLKADKSYVDWGFGSGRGGRLK